jgi:hypothetical protein
MVARVLGTDVARVDPPLVLGVLHRHAQMAATALHESLQQSRSVAYRGCPEKLAVGLQTSLVALELLPGDIGRNVIADAGLPVRRFHQRRAARRRAARLLAPWIRLPSPIHVGPGVDRVAEHVDHHAAMEAVPFEATAVGSRTTAHTHLEPCSTMARSTACAVPRRSNCSKTKRTTARTDSSGSRTTSPDARSRYPDGTDLPSSPRRAFCSLPWWGRR